MIDRLLRKDVDSNLVSMSYDMNLRLRRNNGRGVPWYHMGHDWSYLGWSLSTGGKYRLVTSFNSSNRLDNLILKDLMVFLSHFAIYFPNYASACPRCDSTASDCSGEVLSAAVSVRNPKGM